VPPPSITAIARLNSELTLLTLIANRYEIKLPGYFPRSWGLIGSARAVPPTHVHTLPRARPLVWGSQVEIPYEYELTDGVSPAGQRGEESNQYRQSILNWSVIYIYIPVAIALQVYHFRLA
jgi:hypothetical protein